jgi:hypothetical protein
MMHDQPLLTSSELEFLRLLHQQPGGPDNAPTTHLQVEAGEQFEGLLAGCAAKEKLTIEAHFANQRLTFTPELVEDDQNEHHLRLGTPLIFDEGDTLRAWRSPLPHPLVLQQANSAPSDMWLHELSMSGLLLEQRKTRTTPPQHLNLTLPLAGHPPIAISGRFVRKTEQGLLAYRLAPLDEHSQARLRQFIYQQHRNYYPQAHRA